MTSPAPRRPDAATALAGRMADALRSHPRLSDWELSRLLGAPVEHIAAIRNELATTNGRTVELTDVDLLSVWLSGAVSGACSAFVAGGLDQQQALAAGKNIASNLNRSIDRDPLFRQAILDAIAEAADPNAPPGPGRGAFIRGH